MPPIPPLNFTEGGRFLAHHGAAAGGGQAVTAFGCASWHCSRELVARDAATGCWVRH